MSEQIKNKVLNMEVPPPAGAWDFIAARLDEYAVSGAPAIQKKMKTLSAEPPAFVWNEIKKELDKNAEKVFPLYPRKKFFYLRYAAAVVFIGLVATGISFYFSSNKTNLSAEAITKKDSSADAIAKNNNQTIEPSNTIKENTEKHIAETTGISSSNTSNRLPLGTQDEYTETYAFNEITLQKAGPASYTDEYNPSEGVRLVARDVKGGIPGGINAVTAGSNYFITTGPNGEVVRVSNKLSGVIQLFGDAATQEYLDAVMQESAVWKQKFYNLRNKLSKISPSPNNFFDIVQLAAALKEDKRP
jgi:uncharacterized protein (UPF0333 family)